MTIKVGGFEWDEANVDHIELAHPHISLDDLQSVVLAAKKYFRIGEDQYGKAVYTARQGNLVVYFNIKPGAMVRIFSVREMRKK